MLQSILILSSLLLNVQNIFGAAPLVPVALYFEAQCPGCQQFSTGPLADVLSKPDMAAIIDLKLVPYGNAKQNADGSFSCQHGAGECESDAQELCTQYLLAHSDTTQMWSQSMTAWPFFLCMEQAEGNPTHGEACFASSMANSTVSWSSVSECVKTQFNTVTAAAKDATVKHDCTFIFIFYFDINIFIYYSCYINL